MTTQRQNSLKIDQKFQEYFLSVGITLYFYFTVATRGIYNSLCYKSCSRDDGSNNGMNGSDVVTNGPLRLLNCQGLALVDALFSRDGTVGG